MPTPRPSRLSLLTFPQRWEAGSIRVRFLCLPKGDPTQPFAVGPAAFSTANLVFAARLIGDLEHEPRSADATTVAPLILDNPPVNKALLLTALTGKFTVVARDTPVEVGTGASFRKPLAEQLSRADRQPRALEVHRR